MAKDKLTQLAELLREERRRSRLAYEHAENHVPTSWDDTLAHSSEFYAGEIRAYDQVLRTIKKLKGA